MNLQARKFFYPLLHKLRTSQRHLPFSWKQGFFVCFSLKGARTHVLWIFPRLIVKSSQFHGKLLWHPVFRLMVKKKKKKDLFWGHPSIAVCCILGIMLFFNYLSDSSLLLFIWSVGIRTIWWYKQLLWTTKGSAIYLPVTSERCICGNGLP